MPISSVIRGSGAIHSLIFLFLSFGRVSATPYSYVLDTAYSGDSFFDGFDFFTDTDPTNGFVNYVDQATAQLHGLISSGNNVPAYMGVDYSTYIYSNMTQGRASVRIQSKKTYTHGLFISDIGHMPGSICGTWPAHWTLGPDWPNEGEIDIIEGVNSGFAQANKNLISLHTSSGCTISGVNETGTLESNDCDTAVNGNAGCSVLSDTTTSYGNDFNTEHGGVYATEWTSEYIRVYFFEVGSIPLDITNGTPNPALWGPPVANFQGSCSIDDKFADHKIIFDTTFCGDYAGTVWSFDPTCSKLSLTCNDYVAQHPEAFVQAFWSVNSVKVYQQALTPTSSSSISSTVSQSRVSAVPQSLSSTVPPSSVGAPGMGYSNYSRTAAGNFPTATIVPSIGAFSYLGCAASSSDFENFNEVGNSLEMTLETCTSECGAASYAYAGVFTTHCYCSNSLGPDITVTPGKGSCTNSCPGNVHEFCGGGVLDKRRVGQRQVEASFLLSLYHKTTSPLSSAVPQNIVHGYGMGGGALSVTSTIISTTYIDVCDVCKNGYRTIATAVTIEQCGCMDVTPTVTIPMTTITKLCSRCGEGGGPGVATLTIPFVFDTYVAPVVAVIPTKGALNGTGIRIGGTQTRGVNGVRFGSTMTKTGGPIIFTGDATSLKINVGFAIVGMILLAVI